MSVQTNHVLWFDASSNQVIRQLIAACLQLCVRVLLLACTGEEEKGVRYLYL